MIKSLLFVPAKENMLEKVGTLGADAYIIDLEDSIEAHGKEEALKLAERFLETYSIAEQVFIRLNKEIFMKELECLKRFDGIGFMLPKFEDVSYYEAGSEIFKKHKVIALAETPAGIIHAQKTAECGWIYALAFGAEDYCAYTGMKKSCELLRFQKSCLLTYAKAYGKLVFDTPSFHLGTGEEFKIDVRESADLGFDGKISVSPKHIPFINRIFDRTVGEDVLKIIEQYESTGAAVQVINGKIYEKMHIEALKQRKEQ